MNLPFAMHYSITFATTNVVVNVTPVCTSLQRLVAGQCRFAIYSPIVGSVFNPDANIPKPNRTLIYMGACLIAGMRLAREKQVNTRVVPTRHAIEESVDLAHEVFNRVFRRMPENLDGID